MVAVKDNMNGDPCMLVSEHVCFLLSDVLTDISRTEISTVSLSLLPLPPISLSLSLSLSLSPSLSQVFGSLDTTAADPSSANHQYLINVTLHSGHNLAIRDRTG